MPKRFWMILSVLGLVAIGCDSDGVPRIHSVDVSYDLDAPPSRVSTTTTRPKPVIYLSADTVMPGDELTICGRHFASISRVMKTSPILRIGPGDYYSEISNFEEIELSQNDSWCRTVVVPNRIRTTEYGGWCTLGPGEFQVIVEIGPNKWPLAEATFTVDAIDEVWFTEPSQSPEDARRDQVLQGLAETPTYKRVVFVVEIETPEGVWVLSKPIYHYIRQQCIGLCDSDFDDLRYGIDFIFLWNYSEVLLMDPTETKILRAYPMPGYPAYEMIVTDDAVFTGWVGDGGLPCVSLVRIDRETLEFEAYMFPCEDETGEFWAPHLLLEGWKTLEEYPQEVLNSDYSFNPVALEEFFAPVD